MSNLSRRANWRAIWAIARKDLKVVLQNRGVVLPMILLPVIFLVLIPLLAYFMPEMGRLPGANLSGANVDQFLERMPAGMAAEMAGLTSDGKMVVLLLLFLFAPLYLIIPMMVASVIAADSFAGEKERKTIEAILYTPTTDGELLLGKVLAAWIPAVLIAWLGFALYCVTANLGGWPAVGRLFFPNGMWIVLAAWVAPAVAGLGLSFAVLVSARAQTFQEAYQLSAMVVVPIIALIIGQLTGVMYLSAGLVFAIGLVVWLIDGALLWYGRRTFRRGEVIARL